MDPNAVMAELFGKITGLFWWQPHLAGREKVPFGQG
jgi:hypothetical protein